MKKIFNLILFLIQIPIKYGVTVKAEKFSGSQWTWNSKNLLWYSDCIKRGFLFFVHWAGVKSVFNTVVWKIQSKPMPFRWCPNSGILRCKIFKRIKFVFSHRKLNSLSAISHQPIAFDIQLPKIFFHPKLQLLQNS